MNKIKEAIKTLTGNCPDKIEENCGQYWFKFEGKWYFILIDECEAEITGDRDTDALLEDENARQNNEL